MRRLIGITAVAFGLSAAGAFAQTATDAPPPKAPPEIAAPDAPPPPPPPGPRGPGRGADIGQMQLGPMDRMHRRPPPPPQSTAAHFRVKVGNARIDLKCAEGEPTKDCADLLLQVIDRLTSPTDDQQ